METLQRLSNNTNVPANEVVLLQKELAESKTMVDHYQIVIRELGIGKELLTKKQVELESHYGALESEYEALLEKAVTEEEQQQETLSSHKAMLEQKYAAKRQSHAHEIEDLKKQIAWKDQQEGKLAVAIAELKMANEELQVRELRGCKIVLPTSINDIGLHIVPAPWSSTGHPTSISRTHPNLFRKGCGSHAQIYGSATGRV